MLLKYNCTKPDFVNTSESYSKVLFVGNNNIVVPYINIGLMPNNPITKEHSVIDFSYYALMNVSNIYFIINNMGLKLSFNSSVLHSQTTEYIIMGNYNKNGLELKIECADMILYVSQSAKISDPKKPFIPFNTPHFQENMNSIEVETFFLLDNLPVDVKEMLGENVCDITSV